MNWQALNSISQLEAIKISSNNPDILGILIFKHSTRCETSSMVVDRLERTWNFENSKLPAFFLDLLSYRSISDEIATMFDVQHQSPQVLVIKDGACIFNESHNFISVKRIADFLDSDNM